jgi:hypothetical protein
MKPTEVVRLIEAVKKATGLPVRNVEYNSQTKVLRVSVDPPAEDKSIETRVSVVL